MKQIKIFDTTLRDGEQSPGCSMNLKEKLEVAKCLERLKVDVIEAGFAISSPGDFESVSEISRAVKDCTVASLARATVKDICRERLYRSLIGASHGQGHRLCMGSGETCRRSAHPPVYRHLAAAHAV